MMFSNKKPANLAAGRKNKNNHTKMMKKKNLRASRLASKNKHYS